MRNRRAGSARDDEVVLVAAGAGDEHVGVQRARGLEPAGSAGVAGDDLQAPGGQFCAILPDGNGEFALTVADGWRGWLGPYLLDALVAVAAARGVPNLQADILVSNIRMLALVSNRGYVTLDREASQVRVAIDAAQPRPSPRLRSSDYFL